MVQCLAGHFDELIQTAIMTRGIREIGQLLDLLDSFDIARSLNSTLENGRREWFHGQSNTRGFAGQPRLATTPRGGNQGNHNAHGNAHQPSSQEGASAGAAAGHAPRTNPRNPQVHTLDTIIIPEIPEGMNHLKTGSENENALQ